MPFSELTALQSRVKAEMRAERLANGESPAYRRMTQLNQAIETDLDTAIAGKVAQEAEAVANGVMRVEDTTLARWENFLASEKEQWAAGRSAQQNVASGGADFSRNAPERAPSVLGPHGAEGAARGRFITAPGNP